VFNSQKLKQRLASYSRELQFVLRNSVDWQTCLRLLNNTAWFHAANILGMNRMSGSAFPVKLRLTNECDAQIAIRPFAGDLFILFEVLMDNCYHIPNTILPPEKVRVVLDCGGNIGITALYFAARYPAANIFSIEPDKKNFELLKRNTEAEPRIVAIRGAIVGYPRKTVQLTTGRPAWGNFITEEENGHEVPAVTIDEVLRDYGISRVDLLKVDIEGAERDMFASGKFMPLIDCVIIELHGLYDLTHFSKDVARWGFEVIAGSESDLQMIIALPVKREGTRP
jgi:FkbM family methyltransferase